MKIDEFVKSRIHHVFGVSCLVFGKTLRTSYQDVISLNTKHQILNTLVNRSFFGPAEAFKSDT
ncbi:hypothetical protein D1AOALGA4SA_2227 [Olavius algarvensis Delta 1 endosymbiont]|nr:hypothetical protein D1AOALGA4SA_2227 [Olavius algarvensis Delta 1 endosymbiont]